MPPNEWPTELENWRAPHAYEEPMSKWANTADVPDDFEGEFLHMCNRLECKPLDMIACWYSESGVHSSAHNAGGHASGIFQAMPATLKGMGYQGTHEDYRRLNATEQLYWAEKYYAPYKGHLVSASACYTATFLPAFVKYAKDPNYVLTEETGKLAWAYGPNKVFDANANGDITVGELQQRIDKVTFGPRWDELVTRLAIANVKPEPVGIEDDELMVSREVIASSES